MNQVILAEKASERHGLQPVVHLTANGKIRAEAGVNQPVNLSGTIEMPPSAGKVIKYDWYLGKSDFSYEPATKLPSLNRSSVQPGLSALRHPASIRSRFAPTPSATAWVMRRAPRCC